MWESSLLCSSRWWWWWWVTCVIIEELDVPVLLSRDGDGQRGVTQHFIDLARRFWGREKDWVSISTRGNEPQERFYPFSAEVKLNILTLNQQRESLYLSPSTSPPPLWLVGLVYLAARPTPASGPAAWSPCWRGRCVRRWRPWPCAPGRCSPGPPRSARRALRRQRSNALSVVEHKHKYEKFSSR